MVDERTSFLGRGWSFPPGFNRTTGRVEMSQDEEDVRQSLRILLSTTIGERILEPRYGCNLVRFLFEPLDTTLATYIKHLVRDAILYFEPRVVLEHVRTEVDSEEGRLIINLDYRIPATNTRTNLVFPFYLGEGTAGAR